MVRVEKTDAPNVTVRGIGEFSVGDIVDVSAGDAKYLVEERGDFAYVDDAAATDGPADETHGQEDGPSDPVTFDVADTIEAGKCPWCDDYEGDNVGMHASSAHPDEWDAYKED